MPYSFDDGDIKYNQTYLLSDLYPQKLGKKLKKIVKLCAWRGDASGLNSRSNADTIVGQIHRRGHRSDRKT